MTDTKLEEFIKSQVSKGKALDDIRRLLVSSGWSQDDVDGAINKLKSDASGLKGSKLKKSNKIVYLISSLLIIAIIALAIGFMGDKEIEFKGFAPSPFGFSACSLLSLKHRFR